MKDAMMPQVKGVASRSAVFSQVSALPTKQAKAATQMSEQRLQSFTSAAIWGIAVSLGAASALLLSQDAQAMATQAVSSNFLVVAQNQIGEQSLTGKRETQPLARQDSQKPEALVELPPIFSGSFLARNWLKTRQLTVNLSQLPIGLAETFLPQPRSRWNRLTALLPEIPPSLKFTQISSTEISTPSLAAGTWSRQTQLSSGAIGGSLTLTDLDSDRVEPSHLKSIAKPVYQVQPGDTLEAVAHRYHLSASKLVQVNEIPDPDLIEIGQQLLIPSEEAANSKLFPTPSVLPSTDLWAFNPAKPANQSNLVDARGKLKADVLKLQQEYKTPTPTEQPTQASAAVSSQLPDSIGSKERQKLHLSQQNSLPLQATATAPQGIENYYTRLQPLEGQFVEPELPPLSSPEQYLPDSSTQFNGYIWPSKGVITSGYGKRWGRMHKGIDIAGPVGTPIMAVAPGEVVTAGWSSGGYGNLVKLKHSDGSLTLYAHNSRVLVRRGQKVQQGQLIAEMGSSGYSTGPHLHFEIRPNGRDAVNPIAYLPKQQ